MIIVILLHFSYSLFYNIFLQIKENFYQVIKKRIDDADCNKINIFRQQVASNNNASERRQTNALLVVAN